MKTFMAFLLVFSAQAKDLNKMTMDSFSRSGGILTFVGTLPEIPDGQDFIAFENGKIAPKQDRHAPSRVYSRRGPKVYHCMIDFDPTGKLKVGYVDFPKFAGTKIEIKKASSYYYRSGWDNQKKKYSGRIFEVNFSKKRKVARSNIIDGQWINKLRCESRDDKITVGDLLKAFNSSRNKLLSAQVPGTFSER